MDEDKKKLVDELLYDKECDVRQQLEWIEHQRGHRPDEALKWLAREHEEQKLDIITSWRDAGEAVALAFRLVNRAKAAMDRQGWRFRGYKDASKVVWTKKSLAAAKKGIEEMVKALRGVEFPDTFTSRRTSNGWEISRSTPARRSRA